jgi:hypothetical protein
LAFISASIRVTSRTRSAVMRASMFSFSSSCWTTAFCSATTMARLRSTSTPASATLTFLSISASDTVRSRRTRASSPSCTASCSSRCFLLAHGELAFLHRAVHVFGAQPDGFLGLEPPGLDLLAAGFDHLAGLGLLVGLGLGDGAILLGGVLLVAARLLAFGDVGIGVLLFDLHLGALGELVGEDAFALGDLGDLLDALGVQHVAGIMLVERGLLEIIDRHVLQQKPVQILADGHLDLIAELDPLGEQLVELHLFARRLERLGKLRLEQFPQLVQSDTRSGVSICATFRTLSTVASTRM